jgi:hypothetical protein
MKGFVLPLLDDLKGGWVKENEDDITSILSRFLSRCYCHSLVFFPSSWPNTTQTWSFPSHFKRTSTMEKEINTFTKQTFADACEEGPIWLRVLMLVAWK